MKTDDVIVKTSVGECDAFVAYPSERGNFSAVILYMDVFGLRPYLKELGEQLAALGYYVLVPNLFYRSKKAPVLDRPFPLDQKAFEEGFQTLRPVLQSYSYENCLKDTEFFLEFLSQQKQVRTGKIGLVGYCMGGGLALRVSARFPDRVAAVATFHAGRLATDAPDSPHTLLSKMQAELYIGHADGDSSMPPEQIERLQRALESTSLRYETEVYRGAAHGFTMKDLPPYKEAALKKHWTKLAELFSRNL